VSKTITVALTAMCLSLGVVTEGLTAPSDPNATIPSVVTKDNTFYITVRNCSPNYNYEQPWIEFAAVTPDPVPTDREADADGVSDIPHTYTTPGNKQFTVRCVLDGEVQTETWKETISVNVLQGDVVQSTASPTLTAAEKKKCKRIDNAAKRRSCLRKQAAD
jgi:hypothetical protein